MNSIEKEFAQFVREQKGTIYTVCYMFSNDEEEINDLFQGLLSTCGKAMRHSGMRVRLGHGYIV